MPNGLPDYYSHLAPFRDFFSSGAPILTYHKIKLRPSGARLKGLYLDPRLFGVQLQELRSAGFQSQSLGQLPLKLAKRFVITFDDGFRNVLENAAESLARHQCKAIQFLVADRIGQHNLWETADANAASRHEHRTRSRRPG